MIKTTDKNPLNLSNQSISYPRRTMAHSSKLWLMALIAAAGASTYYYFRRQQAQKHLAFGRSITQSFLDKIPVPWN